MVGIRRYFKKSGVAAKIRSTHMGVAGFKCELHFQFQPPAMCTRGGSKWAQVAGCRPPTWETQTKEVEIWLVDGKPAIGRDTLEPELSEGIQEDGTVGCWQPERGPPGYGTHASNPSPLTHVLFISRCCSFPMIHKHGMGLPKRLPIPLTTVSMLPAMASCSSSHQGRIYFTPLRCRLFVWLASATMFSFRTNGSSVVPVLSLGHQILCFPATSTL